MATFVFHAMGTAGSLRSAVELSDHAKQQVANVFEEWEDRFSLFRGQSEMSKINRREVLMTQASPQMRAVFERADEWRKATEGAFKEYRPDGLMDLGGVVKALAMQASVDILREKFDLQDFCLNMGGDVIVDGVDHDRDGKAKPWIVGIVDPHDRRALLSQFTCTEEKPAVATSGTRERGEHIWRVGSSAEFCQVTVAGTDIETVDVLATAILAGGPERMHKAVTQYPIEVLAVAESGAYYATLAFRDVDETPV